MYYSHADKSAVKIQNAFRGHRARSELQDRAAWQIEEGLEYSSEQTQGKLQDLFHKLMQSRNLLRPTTRKILEQAMFSMDEHELFRKTDPDGIAVEEHYQGPRIEGEITPETLLELIQAFQYGQILHQKYVCRILRQAREILQQLPNCNHVDLAQLGHVYIIGDLHGQLADLLHIFRKNGLPSNSNAYLFNGDFVDRGAHSVEVFLLLVVSVILYPRAVFLNRGNHEDIFLNLRFGFQDEVNRKYPDRRIPLLHLFKDVFSWLPLYSYVDAGAARLLVMHGGISDKIHLSVLRKVERHRYLSIEVRPQSNSGDQNLTREEENEYRQVQDLLWSDPDAGGMAGCRKNDQRGVACIFGWDVTDEFLRKHGLSMIIRSHQVKQEGYEYRHQKKLLTIFSASNYERQNNKGAIIRWDYNAVQPQLIQHQVAPIAGPQTGFSDQSAQFHDTTYSVLMEKIVANRKRLMAEFKAADQMQTGHIPSTAWASIMSNVLQMNLPWMVIRKNIVQQDAQGIVYRTMFDNYALENSRLQVSNKDLVEDLYGAREILKVLFDLIDSNHSGSINRQEFGEVLALILREQNGATSFSDHDLEELMSAMDQNGDGRIDVNEFLGSFHLINKRSHGFN